VSDSQWHAFCDALGFPDPSVAGRTVKAALLPITMDGGRLGVRLHPPRAGEHTAELLNGVGYSHDEIASLRERSVVI
jgi:crotonobetainyl-CoA:carnitine CoA-transferase CaiB-like acyl-CoA transferase